MSSEKAHRVSERKQMRNRAVRTAARTVEARASTASGPGQEAEEAVRKAVSALDRAASKGVLHPRNVARRKSRLMRRLSALQAEKTQG